MLKAKHKSNTPSLWGKTNQGTNTTLRQQQKETQQVSVQCSLAIGAVNDPLERDADSMADQVMRMPENTFVQRKCKACEEEEHRAQRKPLANFIQKKGTEGGMRASETVSKRINVSRGKGHPISKPAKSFMESRFGTDFSKVNIHTGKDAAQMSQELGAKAFTVGNDIYFNQGQYNPNSDSGKHLLAHELTHTLQQSKGPYQFNIMRQEESPSQESTLNTGNVVRVELRISDGSIEPMTNNYPISPNGCLNLPMVGCIAANNRTVTQLRTDINHALISGGFYPNPTVNVSLRGNQVDYTHIVSAGESIFIRTLMSAGTPAFEGSFPIDSDGKIHIPMVGDLVISGRNYFSIENLIKNRLVSGSFLVGPTVHVSNSGI